MRSSLALPDSLTLSLSHSLTRASRSVRWPGFGDVLAQVWLGEEGESFDLKRLGIFTLLGMVFIGPVLHVWYGTLAKLFTGVGTATAVSKLAMDQLLFAPVFIGSIISLIMILEGHGDQVKDKVNNDLFTIVKSNWALWVPFNFLNFRFVPQSLQVLASNGMALIWNTYVSWASHTHTDAGATTKGVEEKKNNKRKSGAKKP